MKALTNDEAILREALVGSSLIIVDNRIKANLKLGGRSTIILREIPSDAPIEEVKEIFNFDGCKPISSFKSEIGDSWFVSMETEDDAKDTMLDLRMKKRTFRGVAVKARLKTESVVRSFFPLQPPAVAPIFPQMMVPFGAVDMRAFGYMTGSPVTMDLVPPMSMMGINGVQNMVVPPQQSSPPSKGTDNNSFKQDSGGRLSFIYFPASTLVY